MRALALLACALLAGCGWRVAPPAPLAEALAIRVVADQGRLPRAGAELQSAAAEAVIYRTGWTVRGDGPARLDLSIDGDDFSAAADDGRGIASRWRYRVDLSALLVTRNGTRTWSGSGTGYAGSRVEEQAAVREGVRDAADALARWLAQGR